MVGNLTSVWLTGLNLTHIATNVTELIFVKSFVEDNPDLIRNTVQGRAI